MASSSSSVRSLARLVARDARERFWPESSSVCCAAAVLDKAAASRPAEATKPRRVTMLIRFVPLGGVVRHACSIADSRWVIVKRARVARVGGDAHEGSAKYRG